MSPSSLTAVFVRCIPRRVTPDLEPKVTLSWLIRLRWLAAVAQLATVVVSRWVLDLRVSAPLLFGVAGVTLASNLALARLPARRSVPALLGGVLALDVGLLTLALAASGGPMNPFTVLYLVHITLSAIALSAGWTTLIGLSSVAGFGLLFLVTPADPHAHHHGGGALGHHLEGMWLAFVLAAGLTAFFVRRIVRAIAGQREQIASLREASARNAKLAALTTLAAGAAHELGSPLGTIAVAAHEAELAAGKLQGKRERLGRALSERGYAVLPAPDYDTAMAFARGHRIERAVVDLRMPGEHGLSVVRDLIALHPSVEVLVLTGYGSIATAVEAMRLGARDYLNKPCHADRILAAFDTSSEQPREPKAFETPSLARLEHEHIERVLRECNGNISQTARVLGIHRRTLQYKLAKFPVTRLVSTAGPSGAGWW